VIYECDTGQTAGQTDRQTDRQTDTITAHAALHYVVQQKIISLNMGCNRVIMITAQEKKTQLSSLII